MGELLYHSLKLSSSNFLVLSQSMTFSFTPNTLFVLKHVLGNVPSLFPKFPTFLILFQMLFLKLSHIQLQNHGPWPPSEEFDQCQPLFMHDLAWGLAWPIILIAVIIASILFSGCLFVSLVWFALCLSAWSLVLPLPPCIRVFMWGFNFF